MKKSYTIWHIVFTIVFILSLWCIDVSVTTMNLGGIMTNGLYTLNPIQTYHTGLMLAIMSFVGNMIVIDIKNVNEAIDND